MVENYIDHCCLVFVSYFPMFCSSCNVPLLLLRLIAELGCLAFVVFQGDECGYYILCMLYVDRSIRIFMLS